MSVQTSGHCEQGGLRGHSRGPDYPMVVIGKGDGWVLLNVLTGEEGPVRATYDEARFHAELDQACPASCQRTKRAALCQCCEWWTSARADETRGRLLIGKNL